jgi:hypothetical protein
MQVGSKKTCVIINVEPEDGEMVASLEGVSYQKECSINNNLEPGSGTIIMLKGCLAILSPPVSFH